jgi:hypothetical protein
MPFEGSIESISPPSELGLEEKVVTINLGVISWHIWRVVGWVSQLVYAQSLPNQAYLHELAN